MIGKYVLWSLIPSHVKSMVKCHKTIFACGEYISAKILMYISSLGCINVCIQFKKIKHILGDLGLAQNLNMKHTLLK